MQQVSFGGAIGRTGMPTPSKIEATSTLFGARQPYTRMTVAGPTHLQSTIILSSYILALLEPLPCCGCIYGFLACTSLRGRRSSNGRRGRRRWRGFRSRTLLLQTRLSCELSWTSSVIGSLDELLSYRIPDEAAFRGRRRAVQKTRGEQCSRSHIYSAFTWLEEAGRKPGSGWR